VLLVGADVIEGRPKSQAGERLIWLDAETVRLLREHRTAQLRARMKAGTAWQGNDLIFCQDDGTPWKPDHVSRRFKLVARAMGLPVIKAARGQAHRSHPGPGCRGRPGDPAQDARARRSGLTSHYTYKLSGIASGATETAGQQVTAVSE
jgi:hypothetical protein